MVEKIKCPACGSEKAPNEIDFDKFWEYLIEESSEPAWWVESWLERTLDSYKAARICLGCQSRRWTSKNIYTKVGHFVLEVHLACVGCGRVVEKRDNRDNLRKVVRDGDVKVKSYKALAKELGIDDQEDNS